MKAKYEKFHLVAVLNDEDLKELVRIGRVIKPRLKFKPESEDFGVRLLHDNSISEFEIDGIHQILGLADGWDENTIGITKEAYERLKNVGYVGRYIKGFGRVDLYTEKHRDAQLALDEIKT